MALGWIITIISFIYLWWVYCFIIFGERVKFNTLVKYPVSIIVPIYNEPEESLKPCIDSLLASKRDFDELILVNNNSNLESCLKCLKDYKKNKKIKIVNETRQGKRFAHSKGLSIAKHDLIVFCDSDTVFDKDAIKELTIPMQDRKIGGVTGSIGLLNKDENIITKSIDAMFYSSSKVFRRASSRMGFMQVMSGAISCYRKEDLMKLEKYYLSQKFLGRPCNISDDRFLTIRIQTLLGKKIFYNDKAKAYTVMPSTFVGFWKTIERWKRGSTREVLIMWNEPKAKSKLLFFDSQFNFIIFNITMIIKIFLMIKLIVNFSFISVFFILFWIFIMNLMWGSFIFVNKPKIFLYKVAYSVFYEFFWSFAYFQALYNLRNQGKWVTR